MSLDMLPNLPSTDKEDMLGAQPVSSSVLAVAQKTGVGADVPNDILGDRGLRELLASAASPVFDLVSHVALTGVPSQMVRVDAPFVALTAVMSGVHSWIRRRAAQSLQDYPANLLNPIWALDDGSSVGVSGKWPNQAFGFWHRIVYTIHVSLGDARQRSGLRERVSVADKGAVVFGAISLPMREFVAIIDKALHLALRSSTLGDIAYNTAEGNNYAR